MQSETAPPGAEHSQMFREAAEAPEVVARQIAANAGRMAEIGRRLRALAPHTVVTCGRGSSDHAATFAKYLIETRLGLPTASAALSVSSVYHAAPNFERVLFLAISQSGRSPDLLQACRAAKAGGATVMALVNMPGSPLEELADIFVPLDAGTERSVAATKSFIATLSALVQLIGAWSEDTGLSAALAEAPHLLRQAWTLDWRAGAEALTDAPGLFVIGRGLGFAAAQEAALKLKETTGLHAEAFSAAEVRHGPMAIVGPGFPVLVLAQDDETRDSTRALAADFAGRGAKVIAAGLEVDGAIRLPTLGVHPALQPLILIQSFYRMAAMLAVARGFDPDHPPHLKKVTETL